MVTKKSKTTAEPETLPAVPYEPTEREKSAQEALIARAQKSKPGPGMRPVQGKDKNHVEVDHADPMLGWALMLESFGTADNDFGAGLLDQIINVASKGKEPNVKATNFMLATVRGIQPRDEVECLLAVQMAAIHNSVMTFSRRINHIETLPQQDSAERALNKLARTFTTQVEALKKYRSSGEQRVTVQHVHVTADKAAVQVNGAGPHGGEGAGDILKSEEQPHAIALENAQLAPLWCPDQVGETVSITSGQR